MDITPDYENKEVRDALDALQKTPDYEHLAAFLLSLREGYLVIDVTGTGKRARTLRSTNGQLVLPIFTSMGELRAAAKKGAKGAVMPALEALALIRSDRFVAAEFDPASSKQVMLRKYVELAAGSDEITVTVLEEMRA